MRGWEEKWGSGAAWDKVEVKDLDTWWGIFKEDVVWMTVLSTCSTFNEY